MTILYIWIWRRNISRHSLRAVNQIAIEAKGIEEGS